MIQIVQIPPSLSELIDRASKLKKEEEFKPCQ